MPIFLPFPIRNLSEAELDWIDATVMRSAYDSQNELGRFCDERVYENDLALRLKSFGFTSVHTQAPVWVRHDSFEKLYQLDLVADDALYELKTVAAFTPLHDAQALNYAMLAGVNHVKLINFRTTKVQGKLRFNALLPSDRRNLSWDLTRWRPLSEQCNHLHRHLSDLLEDWGGFLEARLYEEALIHLFGGEAACVLRTPVYNHGVELGSHLINQHAYGLGFVVTAFKDHRAQREHLCKLRRLTARTAIQWINMSHGTIHLETLAE